MRRVPLVSIISTLLLVAACGASSTGASTSPAPVFVQNCVAQTATAFSGPTPGAAHYEGMTVDNIKRDYRVYEPVELASAASYALVLILHPYGADAAHAAAGSHLDLVAATDGFLAVYPDGCDMTWDATRSSIDVDFLTRMITRLESAYAVDPGRVFVAGFSAGAFMAYRLACDAAGQIAAIAAVGGSMFWDRCAPARPVSVLAMHGTQDASVPYAGGLSAYQNYTVPSVESVVRGWAAYDGCISGPQASKVGITRVELWNRCTHGVAVQLDTVIGGPHAWFGAEPNPLPGEPNANTVVWSFFAAVPTRSLS